MGIILDNILFKITRKLIYLIHCSFYILTDKPVNKEVDCILMCALVNRGLDKNKFLYSQLIDFIYDDLIIKGSSVLSIASEYDNFISKKNYYGNPINLNSYYKKYYFIIFFKNIFYKTNFKEFFFEKIFEIYKTKYFISIQPSKELCIVGRRKNIIIFDLQHGVIGDINNSYYSKTNKQFTQWPNYILCWNENYSNWINSNLNGFTKSIIIGNPNLLMKETNEYGILNFESIKIKYNKVILVSLGRSLKFYNFENEFGITKALINTINNNSNIFWLLKIHPYTLRNKERYVLNFLNKIFKHQKNIDWLLTSRIPIKHLLTNIDLHITTVSATIIEASLLGIKTGVLSNENLIKNLFPVEYNSSDIVCIDNNEESINNFISNDNFSRKKVFNNDYEINYSNFINDIVNKSI